MSCCAGQDADDPLCLQLSLPPASYDAGTGKSCDRSDTPDAPPSVNPKDRCSTKVETSGNSGIVVCFKNLTYTVQSSNNRKEQKHLLRNVDGCFSPHQMSALMGPSGSGKTTLLDCLAGRKTVGELSGDVLFSAHKPSRNFLRRYTGYVEQFDTLIDMLTVKEMLMYTAELKRDVAETRAEKEKVVDHFIQKLGLGACKDVRIGNSMKRGISGGQAKRVNIALAMVVNPKIIFLDEAALGHPNLVKSIQRDSDRGQPLNMIRLVQPTSGLDSYTANEVMTVVRSLIDEGITICATIHSPSPYCFSLFDRLMVLVRGEVVYHGPNGEAMVEYFSSQCGVPLPKTALMGARISNNADFLTDLVAGADREGRAHEYAEAYAKSSVRREMASLIESGARKDSFCLSDEEQTALSVSKATATPLWKGFLTMIQYRTSRNYRDAEFLWPRVGDKLVFCILVATLYLGLGDNFELTNLTNISSVFFMWTTLPAFGAASYVPALTLEKPLFVRERADGLYRPITYLLAKFADELFVTVTASLAFAALVWFAVQFQGSFLLFWLVYLVTLCNGITVAYVVATIAPNMDIANAAVLAYTATFLFFSGYLMRFPDMPAYWEWYSYINPLRYAWSALMINQFKGRDSVQINGVQVLDFYGLTGSQWAHLGCESMFFCLYFLCAWLALQFKTLNKR